MDPKKRIRNSLKQAKVSIKNKDINRALHICKAVLKEDRDNYIALVLLGAAFQESEQKDQAPNAYHKAIEISPNQTLAWHGLATYYEKDDGNKHAEQLAPVYHRLLQIESDTTKWCDVISKMRAVIMKFESDDYVAQIVAAHKHTHNNDKLDALRKLAVHYLSEVNEVPEQNLKLFEELLNYTTTGSDSEFSQVYLKLLYNQKKTLQLLSHALKLSENHQDPRTTEWICKVCSEEFVDNRGSVVEWCNKLPLYYNTLLKANKDNVLALMAQGAYLISQRSYVEARTCLQHCLSLSGGLFHAVCLLAEANLHLLCLEQAETCARTAITLRPAHIAPKAVLAKALSLTDDPTNWGTAVSLASMVLAVCNSELAIEGLCQAHLRLRQWSELLSAVTRLTHADALATLLRLEAAQGVDLLYSLSQDTPDCPEAWYRLGLLYIAADLHDLACTAFLKCAKLAPHWYTAYLQLGHLYARSFATLDKARRCYQHTLVLNPSHIPAQVALSDTYRALGDAQSNLELLEGISQALEGKWAWARLGLQYSELGDTTAAINCLRSALKTDPNNSHLWEALADAYLARGANGSALKSYQKVLELKPGTFYPALQIATIKQITDMPEDSLLEFRELVEQQPTSVLAFKGLCETCLCLAKNFLTRRLLGLAKDRLQEGLTAISRALEVRPDLACLWKLAGDTLTLAGSLPPSWYVLQVSKVLCPKTGDSQALRGLQMLELGARCMCRCLKLMAESGKALVWHDLALNYRKQARLSSSTDNSNANSTDNSNANSTDNSNNSLYHNCTVACTKALAAAKESVVLSPLCWQHWNQLGIVAAMPEVKHYALAQHSFIKATTLDETVAVPWANLGCLYLTLDKLKLANTAFSSAQRIDSEFGPSWIGQAIIAEQVYNEETMDLFRHTTQLGYHVESCLGYAQLVCQTLQLSQAKNHPHYIYSIEKMHAVPVAVDALIWATDEEQENACALNMLGCLLERCSLYRTSVQVLSRAVDHCHSDHRDKVLANFARVLLKADKVDDAIDVYNAISKADIHTQCGLALAHYKGKQYKEAYEAYEAALNWWAADDEVKAHLHVALAAVAYNLHGADQAKTLLLQGKQLKAQSIHGLFAACSLGMLNGDLELSKLVLRDMLMYQNEMEYVSHIALFQAYTKFIQGDARASVWSMSKTVHRQPSLAAVWLHLALLILQSLSSEPSPQVVVAARCARTAMALGRTYMDVSKVLAVVSLSHLLGGNPQQALSSSQHAVHLYPAVGESWAVLAASCHAVQAPTRLRQLISHVRQNIDLERPLAKWMSNFERKISMLPS